MSLTVPHWQVGSLPLVPPGKPRYAQGTLTTKDSVSSFDQPSSSVILDKFMNLNQSQLPRQNCKDIYLVSEQILESD